MRSLCCCFLPLLFIFTIMLQLHCSILLTEMIYFSPVSLSVNLGQVHQEGRACMVLLAIPEQSEAPRAQVGGEGAEEDRREAIPEPGDVGGGPETTARVEIRNPFCGRDAEAASCRYSRPLRHQPWLLRCELHALTQSSWVSPLMAGELKASWRLRSQICCWLVLCITVILSCNMISSICSAVKIDSIKIVSSSFFK